MKVYLPPTNTRLSLEESRKQNAILRQRVANQERIIHELQQKLEKLEKQNSEELVSVR